MKVTVKLYGTLRRLHPGYRHADGIIADVPEGTTIADLFSRLELPLDRNVSVIMDGRIQKTEVKVYDGACLNAFLTMHGG
jgi:hypothetical protein